MAKLKSLDQLKAELAKGEIPITVVAAGASMIANSEPFAGYHKFRNETGEPHGSFEVFHATAEPHWSKDDKKLAPKGHGKLEGGGWIFEKSGWYWWPCFPGCLPDGEASGPFATAEGAYLDALGD